MMAAFIGVTFLTLMASWLCNMLEGFILGITTAEVESVKAKHPRIGVLLDYQKNNIERATSAILTLNTLGNIAGSAVSGYLAGEIFGSMGLAILTVILTLVVLFFGEILPKNIGFLYRRPLAIILPPILQGLMIFFSPIAGFSRWLIHLLLPKRGKPTEEEREQEVLLLVNKGLVDGVFSVTERAMISNTLRLDDLPATTVMTPLERVTALPAGEHLSSVLQRIGSTRFSRLPVYDGANIVGLVTRDDLLHAGAMDQHATTVGALMKPILKLSSASTIADLLQHLLKNRQEMCIIESPSQQTLGLATMEDIVRHLLGARHTHK